MEKLGERIGLFDLWALFYPGVIGTLEVIIFTYCSFFVSRKCSILNLHKDGILYNMTIWIIWIIVSIFMGLLLQEIGRWMRKMTKHPNTVGSCLNPKFGFFSEKEYIMLESFLNKYEFDRSSIEEGRIVFHRINAEAQECGVAARYVKLCVLQSMSLSLSASMLLGAIEFSLLLVVCIAYRFGYAVFPVLMIILFHVLLTVIFYKRSNRFYRYWVRNIVYAMYVKNSENGKDENVDKKAS